VLLGLFGMIPGTQHSPGQAFIQFARAFLEDLARGDVQSALGALDMTKRRWTKRELLAELTKAIGNEGLCSSAGFVQSASPQLVEDEERYVLRHKLPVGGKWSSSQAVFLFTPRTPGGGYCSVELVGFE
jgi:hypothetical protein